MLNGRKRRFLQEVNFKVFKNHLKINKNHKQEGGDNVQKEVKIKRIHEVEKRLRDIQKMLSDDLLSAYKEKDINKADMLDKYLTSVNEIINACESRGRF